MDMRHREYELQYAVAMQWLARKEGRMPALPATGDTSRHGKRGRKGNASDQTVTIMRLIAKRPYSTRELVRLTGFSADQVSWRLQSMTRNDFLEKIGEEPSTDNQKPCNVYRAGPRMAEWLKTYEDVA